MPFTQFLLLKIPTALLGVIIVAGAAILSVATLLTVRRFIPHHRLKAHNDVAGSIFATLGVLYAVLLAFVVIIVWQGFDNADLNVQKEANCLTDLYRDAEPFSLEFRHELYPLLDEYVKTVVNEEWKTMERGEASPHAAELIRKLWPLYSAYLPKNATEVAFFQESVRKLNELGEFRRLRIMDSRSGVNPLLWIVLISGGVITVTFISFFGSENLRPQMTMAILLAMLVGLILFTIAAMDFPFTGSVSVSKDAFTHIIGYW